MSNVVVEERGGNMPMEFTDSHFLVARSTAFVAACAFGCPSPCFLMSCFFFFVAAFNLALAPSRAASPVVQSQ